MAKSVTFPEKESYFKTFSYRIKNPKGLDEMAKKVNFVWNYCNETQIKAVKTAKKWPSKTGIEERLWPTWVDLCNLTAGTSKDLGLHSDSIKQVCIKYYQNRKKFNKPFLRFRGKKSLGWLPFTKRSLYFSGDNFSYLDKSYKVWFSRKIEGDFVGGSFSQDSRGRWYINLHCRLQKDKIKKNIFKLQSVGIDFGLKNLATFSDGTIVENMKFDKKMEEKISLSQKNKKKKHAKKLYAKAKNQKNDYLNKISNFIAKTYKFVVVGDINSKQLQKTYLSKSVNDACWGKLKTMLSYKTIRYGGKYLAVDESYTTQTCSCCKAVSGPKGLEGLGIREWTCAECNTFHDRDVNSAKNILALGHQSLAGGDLSKTKKSVKTFNGIFSFHKNKTILQEAI